MEIFDYLVVADGVFSLTKSILFNTNIKPKYSGSFAIRAFVKKENLKFFNEKNISLFFGPKMHLVIYPINFKSEFNLVIITRRSLSDENFFKNEANIKEFIKDSIIQKNSKTKQIILKKDAHH